VTRDADWAAAATDRPLPAADHWGVEDPAAPVEPPARAAQVAVGHTPTDTPVPTFKESGELGLAEADSPTDARRRAPEDEPAWNRPSGVSPITRGERRAAEAAAAARATGTTGMGGGFGHLVWALTRVLLGFVFLWAFLDKLLGFGRSTEAGRAWRDGVSPTTGYLEAVDGPLAGFFDRLAGRDWVDWVFMIALAAVGVALILGIGVVLAAVGGAILLVMMWLASLPITANPFVDDHLIYALVIIGIAATGAGLRYSLAPWWRRTWLVRKLPFLK
jgi:thiosulfate dehydrogenase [quinone] large subunit